MAAAEGAERTAAHMARMAIDQPNRHPQVTAFTTAAELMKAERYWQPSQTLAGQIEFMQALEAAATELVFQLSQNWIMDQAAAQHAILRPIEQRIANLQAQRDA